MLVNHDQWKAFSEHGILHLLEHLVEIIAVVGMLYMDKLMKHGVNQRLDRQEG